MECLICISPGSVKIPKPYALHFEASGPIPKPSTRTLSGLGFLEVPVTCATSKIWAAKGTVRMDIRFLMASPASFSCYILFPFDSL